MARYTTFWTSQDQKDFEGLPRHPNDLSEQSCNQGSISFKQLPGTNMALKFPEITRMLSGLTSKMENPSGKRQLILNLTKSRSTKSSRIWDLHHGITPNSRMQPRIIKRSKFTLCLLSNIMDATRQGRLLMDISPDNWLRWSTQELFHSGVSGL